MSETNIIAELIVSTSFTCKPYTSTAWIWQCPTTVHYCKCGCENTELNGSNITCQSDADPVKQKYGYVKTDLDIRQ